ncbi:5-methylcytosine restriction system specificity protein McrC [Mycolicibacterium sediminis]|uniref:5-methylcytosine-specific restriction system specificity protein McrC n=1 Tax=Mycolicibacterium sediminis TaxID=1286180 RepID=A0A7I7QP23_9MYCO|nr:hypothetical protein [Mycolicibacterium sediminis]BBY28123.1 hypothetical protein MSEDJ_22190 [Mycolicibacterium sediminis]
MVLSVGQGKTEIPIRSLWLLLIYASDLLSGLRSTERESLMADSHDADLIGAIADVLVTEVEHRLRQQLSFHYRSTSADLTRVRGRIDHLRTGTAHLLDQGRIACVFDELTVNSPRNRFVAATLRRAARLVESKEISRRCAAASFTMQRLGVSPQTPSRPELSKDRLGHHDSHDRRMLDAAHLVNDMAVPFHEHGSRSITKLLRDEGKYRKLFEKAVKGYFTYTLRPHGWTVHNPELHWQHGGTGNDHGLLPAMKTDVVLLDPTKQRRIVIEVKFKDALVNNYADNTTIHSGFLYQLYAYLKSQAGPADDVADHAEGVLLFVVANGRDPVNAVSTIQGHPIRFLSVDMTGTPSDIRNRWDLCLAEAGTTT